MQRRATAQLGMALHRSHLHRLLPRARGRHRPPLDPAAAAPGRAATRAAAGPAAAPKRR
eukprot:CAMPEP_0177414810 /NCGR_PEP_ID=MMETSP0368-20130122/67250_1 /TAXON_ID=447022 ORGANISM="Scrippsiella hangoei-like, Strain SHHI-4" /NCGR_SAMPLE_ID=MMETSP0368 /ASSEMBLY_ACC=CAM_ASM_000363 /LENGTH=58 /DNA_ID=CAMNT_0018884219 /DNA_START=236 /DNA_END=408 /DNA_ORIENTATION=-